ncbi:tyrosinase family protein [Rhodanobacter lindaniclasticus]
MTTILSDTNFFTFSSQLEEGTPHNTAHVIVGMDMGTGGSPLDPIFWAHHGMVDYCWAKWNIELHNDNPNDPDLDQHEVGLLSRRERQSGQRHRGDHALDAAAQLPIREQHGGELRDADRYAQTERARPRRSRRGSARARRCASTSSAASR